MVYSFIGAAQFPDVAQNIGFGYDNGKGRMTSAADPAGSIAIAYNALGQVTQETRVIDGRTYTTQYAYDPVTADLQTVTYPSGLAVTYQRDGNGRISGITAGGQTLAGNVSYLPFGPANGMTLGSVPVTRTFNQRYLLTGISVGSVMNLSYDYDGAGNVKRVSGLPRPPLVPGTTDYSYTANRLVSSSGLSAKSYSYDNVGNIISDGVRSFVYDQSNRLIRVTKSGVVLGEYAYDAFNRRVKKIVGGKTTHFLYDADGLLICETDAGGNAIRDYVYLNGEPVAMKAAGSWYWFLCDHLGTPQKLIDNSGNLVWEAAYLPFGKARVITADIENNLRFPGQYFDEETGLHYNWHRYYDPESGRYWTADPIGLSGGINLYAYVDANPVIRTDPLGLWFGIDDVFTGPVDEILVIGAAYYALKNAMANSDKKGCSNSNINQDNTSPGTPPEDPDDDDRARARHAKDKHSEWSNHSEDELIQKMKDIREKGTPYRAGNGNILYKKGKTIMIENKFAPNKGTMFIRNESSKNIGRYIKRFLKENR